MRNWDTVKAKRLLDILGDQNGCLCSDVMVLGDCLHDKETERSDIDVLGYTISRIGEIQITFEEFGSNLRYHLFEEPNGRGRLKPDTKPAEVVKFSTQETAIIARECIVELDGTRLLLDQLRVQAERALEVTD